mgnify:CR=1 FL=1
MTFLPMRYAATSIKATAIGPMYLKPSEDIFSFSKNWLKKDKAVINNITGRPHTSIVRKPNIGPQTLYPIEMIV